MAELPYFQYRKQVITAAIVTWFSFVWFILLVDPLFVMDVGWKNSYLPFLLLLSAAICLTLWGVTGRIKRAGLWTLIVVVGFWLRINQLDTLINLVLLFAFGLVWEYYWKLSRNM